MNLAPKPALKRALRKPKKMLEVVTAVIGNIMIWEKIINETTV